MGRMSNNIAACLHWPKINSSSRNPSASTALCHGNRSTYRLPGPAGIGPQQTQCLERCGCEQEVSLALYLSLSLSCSPYGCTLICYQQSLLLPHPLIAAAAAAAVVSQHFHRGPCRRLSPGESQSDVSHINLLSSFYLFDSIWQRWLPSDLCVCHREFWASLLYFFNSGS